MENIGEEMAIFSKLIKQADFEIAFATVNDNNRYNDEYSLNMDFINMPPKKNYRRSSVLKSSLIDPLSIKAA